MKYLKQALPYLITAGVSILAVKVIYPKVQPTLARIPVIGSFFAP